MANGTMPPSGSAGVSNIQMVRDWIDGGAKLDSNSNSNIDLTAALPARGVSIGGTSITLTGHSFSTGMQVSIGGSACGSVQVASPVQASCITSAHAVGIVEITVNPLSGPTFTLPSGFEFILASGPAPTISSISPASGTTNGGTALTINGTGFDNKATVLIGTLNCTPVNFVSASKLTCTTTASVQAGAMDIKVTNSDGQSGKLTGAFTYSLTANYSSIYQSILQPKCVSCHTGSNAGDGFVDLSSYAAMMASGSTVVAGSPSTSRLYLSSSGAGATMPPSPPLLNATEQKAISDWISAGAIDDHGPTVTSISPTSGNTNGGTKVTITGTNFASGMSVALGGSACTPVVVTGTTQATCTTSAHAAAAVDIVASTADGPGTLSGQYTYSAGYPTLTSIAPASGPIAGGTLIVLTGTGFVSTPTVTVGGSGCTGVIFTSSTSISCTTAAHAAGIVDVTVTNPNALYVTKTGGFTYGTSNPKPTVTAVSPTSGSMVGGDTLTITGTGFLSGATVTADSATCGSVAVVSATKITCVTAAKAPNASRTAGAVVVTNTDTQSGSKSAAFTYTVAPTWTAISKYIFAPSCVGCHTTGNASKGVNLSTYALTISTGSVVANNLNSTTYTDMNSGRMPTSGTLPASDIAAVKSWIQAGALNN